MQVKSKEMLTRVKQILVDNQYVYAHQIASQTGLTTAGVYKAISILRVSGIGVYASRKGYILAEFATQRDDIENSRKLVSRRTADYINFSAAERHMKKRWGNSLTCVESVRRMITFSSVTMNNSIKMINVQSSTFKMKPLQMPKMKI